MIATFRALVLAVAAAALTPGCEVLTELASAPETATAVDNAVEQAASGNLVGGVVTLVTGVAGAAVAVYLRRRKRKVAVG